VTNEIAQLMERVHQGDEEAAQIVFFQHMGRLIGFARSRLSSRLKRRIDPEDIVQSAMGSFIRNAQAGRYTLDESGDLWRLLVVITLNKLRQKVEYHQAGKRRFDAEQSARQTASGNSFYFEAVARTPGPGEELALVEEIEQLTQGMDELQKQIVELRLQGYQIAEIAEHVSRSERTVRRVMDKVKTRLEQRLQESSSAAD